MRFNIVHVLPPRRVHGPMGYAEMIESLQWGLRELGHEATIGVNNVVVGVRNIVVGFQMFEPRLVQQLPDDTIVYNLEQLRRNAVGGLGPAYLEAAIRLQIWDYNADNVQVLKDLYPARTPLHVPIGWAAALERIPKADVQDIDVLFYGGASDARLKVFQEVCGKGVTAAFISGMYGVSRDALIARAKIVLNLRSTPEHRVFEIVRVSYLLMNGKAVVSDLHDDSSIESDMREAVAFAPVDEVVRVTLGLLKDDAARRRLEESGRAVMRKRDIREILRRALSGESAGG